MLELTIPEREFFDNSTQTFIKTKERHIKLEHSLLSISKWEAKWCVPFLGDGNKTNEQIIDYVRCMMLTPDEEALKYLTRENYSEIQAYIEAPMTATVINRRNAHSRKSNEIVTSELIYYWMIALQIPWECQKWHLNRLMMLIDVCSVKNQPNKKMSNRAVLAQNKELNEQRRAKSGSKG